MRRTAIIILVGLAVIASACGNDDDDKKASNTKAADNGPSTLTVKVDNQSDKFNGAWLAYFPNDIAARPGDTVDFKEIWTGEPHTVTMGTLVEAGLTAQKAVTNPAAPPAPGFASLPTMFPEGPGDAHQNGAQPCFLDSEKPPTDVTKACPKVSQPAFNGRQSYYNSGFLPEGKTFSVKLADDIAPGAYRYYCNLHGPDMGGTINVKAKGEKIPSAAEVESAGNAQRDASIAKIQADYDAAKTKVPIAGATALAGFGNDAAEGLLVDEFLPAVIDAKVGQKVTWAVSGPHTVTFNGTPDLGPPPATVASDGTVHLNEKGQAPIGGPGYTPAQTSGPPPEGPPKLGKVLDHGRWDGTGIKSSGFFPPGPPPLPGYSLTFTKPGTYSYLCTIHPKMGGVVKVT